MRMPAPHSSSTQLQKNTQPEHILESELATKCGMLSKMIIELNILKFALFSSHAHGGTALCA